MSRTIPLVAWGFVVLAYLLTCSPYLAPADSPEFVALMVYGGFAHAPGSPTTVLIYQLFSWIPADPRLVASGATAVIGSGAVGLIYLACRAWGLARPAAAGAMLLVGLHAQVWLVHTHPEAFAVNNLFAAAILWLSAPNGPLRGTSRVAALGILAGVGLGAHQSLVLLAPIGLWGVWIAVGEARRGVVALVVGGLLLVAGFSVYGTMMLWESPVSFGRIETVEELLHHLLRSDYGTMSLSAGGTAGPLDQLPFWVGETLTDSGVVGLLLLVAGLVSSIRAPGAPRSGWRALLVTWIVCGPLFIGVLNLSPQGPGAEMVKRFHVLPWFVAAPFLALGVQWLLDVDIERRLKMLVGGAALAMLLFVGVLRTSAVYSGSLEDALRNTLRTLPPDAVLFGQGDHRYFGFQYLQQVEGMRPDVVAIEPSALGHRWYVDRNRERLGLAIPYTEERIALAPTLDMLMEQTDRPVFVTRDFAPEVLAERRMVPDGPAWRLLRADEAEPSAQQVYESTRAAFDQFEHRASPPEYLLDPWGWSLFNTQRLVWEDVAARCEREQAACAAPAAEMLSRYPDL